MALFKKLVDITTAQSTLEQKHNILNHVFVSDEVKEGGKWLNSLRSKVLEFSNKLVWIEVIIVRGGVYCKSISERFHKQTMQSEVHKINRIVRE